ncbi:bifunctional DedA family/phosphatase PAP2 family protein [Halomonas sp. 18H]|uniref:bifunctional DedA family/phosphatase PAP2 family protein n=1 Tax=Halomonas almeriensis TaxID=308163 RepID=UPI002230946F|nr:MULTISPECIES: bifunctional DedA family/phosphatase PAP2 family protein [Halomonas]MCW4151081.1 bifunctional DedA family/phosphatase PAP2 family protein [Halomonas sp. 18H]MDN3552961.1 bifunctional DedA family/phosphatase PAP2 family protein [Halomonas almeriensis]
MNLTDAFYQLSPSPTLLLVIVGLVAMVESLALVGLLVPGVVLITAASSMAGHQELAVIWVILMAFLGAVAGDGLSFWLGYRHRERVPTWWPLSRHPEWLSRGARFFKRHGALSVLLGRFVGPVRPIIPLIAGMLHMSPRRFLWANVMSAVLWAPAYVLPGYLLGHAWQRLPGLPAALEPWLATLGGIIVVLAIVFSWLRHQTSRDGHVYRALVKLARYSRVGRMIWRLLALQRNSEPPLASWLLLLASLSALCALTLVVLQQDGPLPMDQRLHDLLGSLSMSGLETTGLILAEIGDLLGILALVVPWALWWLWQKRWDALAHLGGGLLGIAVLNVLGKTLIDRARPMTPEHLTGSMAYPSAHTSTAVVLLGMAAAFIARELPPGYRFWAYWVAIALAVPMALSRLFIGVHWLSDLIGGALLGLVVCALVQLAWQRRPRDPLSPAPWPWLATASLALLTARVWWVGPA